MKKIDTKVSTGDILNIKGKECRIGIQKRIDGKMKIALHYRLSETSGYTEFVTTFQLNKLLKDEDIA